MASQLGVVVIWVRALHYMTKRALVYITTVTASVGSPVEGNSIIEAS